MRQVTISEATMRRELEESKAELEMARVHLAQLRGSGGGREGEVDTLTTELQQVRRGVSSTVKLSLAISGAAVSPSYT